MTMDLIEYVRKHTRRGECQCGLCIDKGNRLDPKGHTADLIFFKVVAKDHSGKKPDGATLKKLAKSYRGTFAHCDPFDGKEHNFMELGAWIGDQGLAMQFMGLASLLGLCKLLTPKTVLGKLIEADPNLSMTMAQQGMVAIQAA